MFFSLAISFYWLAASASTPPKPPPGDLCQYLLLQSQQVAPVENVLGQLDNMKTYLEELRGHHEGRGTQAVILSTPDAARQLEQAYGPIISTTTFSRELNSEEYLEISSQILGFLSGLPQGRAIIASGGTMGSRSTPGGTGGGVGITQKAAMQLGFKTMSITAVAGFQYRAAPADYLLYSMDRFGSESRMMYELSKALVVVGGGGQAFKEASEYLVFNPEGYLVVIDDPKIGGTSASILGDPRFSNLAKIHPRIIVAKTGSEAGILLSQKLGLSGDLTSLAASSERRINLINPNADLHQLLPNSFILGFSGWSDIRRAGPDVVRSNKKVVQSVQRALEHIHAAVSENTRNVFYATAGNDPVKGPAAAFETLVHNLAPSTSIHYLALTARELKVSELNSRIRNVSVVADRWSERTQQLVTRVDGLVTSGGNEAVIDQAIHAANLQKPHLHILGANSLTDMRIEKISNPNLKCLTTEQVLALGSSEIRKILGLEP